MIESVAGNGPFALPEQLPNNVPDCHALIYQMNNRILELEKQKRRRDRTIHGPRSAKVGKDSLEGEGKEIYENTCREVDAEMEKNGHPGEPTHGGGGRNAPQSAAFEETKKHEETDPSKLLCKCCNLHATAFSFKISYQLEYIPGTYKRIKHVEYQYSCPRCKQFVTSKRKPFQPIDKGYPGPGLLAYLTSSRLARHLPNYRLEAEAKSLGIALKRSTMSRWQMQLAAELKPLWDLMHKRILESRVIEADETNMPFIRKGTGHTVTGKVSIYRGDETRPYNIYNFSEDGKGENHEKMLPGYKGFLLTDGTAVFNGVLSSEKEQREGATSANCWAHAERYFEDAKKAEEKLADYALGIIKSVFKIERYVMTLPENERVPIRQRMTKPLLDDFKVWLDSQKTAAPTAFADAVQYTLNRWPQLCQFLNHGFLKAHNNDSENGLRAVVLHRKNSLFAGSAAGGKSTAILNSFVQTCRRLNIDSFEYLKDVLTRLPETPITEIDQFLPDKWKALKAQPQTTPAKKAS